ncbi:MAG TPA: hypothetical protein PLD84_09800, partial [Chitinophagales bacterium]|nr:hypothetical protein [Chitinophagales bacterium]
CLSEDGASPGKGTTFIRYYNGGNNDQANALEMTADGGFVILASTRVQKTEADIAHYKIKLIKTDAEGNPLVTAFFPDINSTAADYTGSSLQSLPGGGYVVTGEDIQSDGTRKVLIMTVDDNLAKKTLTSIYADGTTVALPNVPPPSASGKAVTVNSNGNILVLSSYSPDKMYLTEIDKTNFTTVKWVVNYAAGATNLATKLFVDENGKILWSGLATKNGLTGIRMIKTPPNSINSEFDLLISNPGFTEVGTDFCRFGYGYAITGSTNQKQGASTPAADTDILFKRLAPDGTVLSTSSFPIGDKDSQNDVGNSISSTQDGGLILLSSVNSAALGDKGKGDTDYYLIKINAFGTEEWHNSFGSRYKDEGVAIRQISAGGYVLLGTTTQGALRILTLIKTDKNGNIE